MAKVFRGDWIIFDAATQGEGFGPNEDSISVSTAEKLYVQRIKIDTGDGGDVLIRSRNTASASDHARYDVVKADNTTANATMQWPIGKRVDGLYVVTLPANATITVILGYENEV
jgi:hypothetical protein